MSSLLTAHGLTDDHLREIGAITAGASILDSVLDVALGYLLGLDKPAGLSVASPMQTANKIHLLRAIGEQRIDDQDTRAAFAATVNAVSSALGKRNDIVHGRWRYFPETKRVEVIRYTVRDGGLRELPPKNATVAWLHSVASEIERATARLDIFLHSLRPYPAHHLPASRS